MAFQFPLAAVLRLRESLEKREERALQSMQREIARTRQQIEEMSVAIGRAHLARERALVETISGGQLHSLLWEEQATERQLVGLVGRLQVLEQEREAQMRVYQGAHRDREMLTDMYAKQKGVYQREWLREEQRRLDDIFMARRHRIS